MEIIMALLKDLYEELREVLGYNDKEDVPKKKKAVELEDEEDETPVKKKKVVEEEEDEAPKKSKSKAPTLADVKLKVKEVLTAKGKDAAITLLEAYEAEKIGDLEEEQYADFIVAADMVLKKGPSTKKKPSLDLDEEDEE
jgi:hypothetical protein